MFTRTSDEEVGRRQTTSVDLAADRLFGCSRRGRSFGADWCGDR